MEEREVLAKMARSSNESKSRFLFNMSYDIRTPLNEVAILEDAGFLVEQAVDGQKAVEKVKDAADGY